MKIAVLEADAGYERRRARSGERTLEHSMARHAATAAAVREALEAEGHQVDCLPASPRLPERLASSGCELVFNTYFGPGRRDDQARMAALVELGGLPATSGDAACHFVGLSKPLTKHVLRSFHLPSPGFVVCGESPDELPGLVEREGLSWPLIVKTSTEGEGIGIDSSSVVDGPEALREVVARVLRSFGQAVVVEEYIAGRELTVGVIDGEEPRVLPVLELLLGEHRVYSYEVKARGLAKELCPAPLTPQVAAKAGELAIRAGRAIGCRDYWRVDFRLDAGGALHILEVNTLPGLQPGYSDLPVMAQAAGLSYRETVRVILASASRRLGSPA